jgi:hypothetical protein
MNSRLEAAQTGRRGRLPYRHPPGPGKWLDRFGLRREKRWLQSCPQLEPPVAVVLFFLGGNRTL